VRTSSQISNDIDNLTAAQRDHDEHVAVVNAHVPVGRCPKTDAIFKNFLIELLDKKPSELASLCDYQIPHGNLETARVFHILHWPSNPSPPSTQPALSSAGPAKFRFDAYTLKIVTSMFPGSKESHYFHDFVPKHMKITDEHGARLSNDELYGDLPLEECVELVYALICESDAELIPVHGGPARRALKQRLGLKKERRQDEHYEMIDVEMGGKMVSS
jgi:hypothetical protein